VGQRFFLFWIKSVAYAPYFFLSLPPNNCLSLDSGPFPDSARSGRLVLFFFPEARPWVCGLRTLSVDFPPDRRFSYQGEAD